MAQIMFAAVLWPIASVALGAPDFTGEPADVRLAQAVWASAVSCTEREGTAHDTVEIRRDYGEAEGIAAIALWDAEGLYAIRLTRESPSILLAHELGHAWFHGHSDLGPLEGRTELLAECVAAHSRDVIPYLYDAHPSLEDLPDITRWTAASQASMRVWEVNAVYAGSLRFFAAMATVVEPATLMRSENLDWAAVRKLLAEVDRGQELLEVLDGGANAQRAALIDPDKDGVTTVVEQLQGTDPLQWDTDGDGWWDGAPTPRPDGVRPVPGDGTPICPPRWSPTGKSKIIWGGNLRGFGLDVRGAVFEGDDVHIWLPDALKGNPGGFWFEVIGKDLVDNPRCGLSAAATIRSDDRTMAYLPSFEKAIVAAAARATDAQVPSDRVVVDLGGLDFTVLPVKDRLPLVFVPAYHLKWASKDPQRMTALAEVVVAMQRIASSGRYAALEDDPGLTEALQQHFGSVEVPARLRRSEAGSVEKWRATVEQCGGWPRFLDIDCVD